MLVSTIMIITILVIVVIITTLLLFIATARGGGEVKSSAPLAPLAPATRATALHKGGGRGIEVVRGTHATRAARHAR